MYSFAVFVLFLYVVDVLAMFYFGIHCYVMLYLYLKNPEKCSSSSSLSQPDAASGHKESKDMQEYPHVTVQLPMFNEYYVAGRLIDSVASLDYPKDKLEIQVLDDSTDECRLLVQKKVAHYQSLGFNIHHIHRKNREGHKAGALKMGLEKAKGEFIAIFDADFIPMPQFLRKTVPFFYTDDTIGMVQARWGHVNDDYSSLTKAQSIGVDGHFMIEQVARNASDLWMNFNGTAGIWRKTCIMDAGNWHYDTLTEDFDLSYRAELRGWKFKYLSDVLCPAELPATVTAFKSQQFRWCKGSIQTAVKLIPRILRSKEAFKVKVEAVTHLLNYSVHPLIYLNILLTMPVVYFQSKLFDAPLYFMLPLMFILGLATMGPIVFYAVSQKHLYADWRRRLRFLPVLSMIGSGISLSNTKAWLEGIMGKQSSFVRTPKMGITSQEDHHSLKEKNRYNHPRVDFVTILELFTILYILGTILYSIHLGKWVVIPYLLIYFFGFFYVNFLSFSDYFRGIFRSKTLQRRNL